MTAVVDKAQFVARYGGVYEHSPWIAEALWDASAGQLDVSPQALANLLASQVEAADPERQLDLLKAHPDLAGRAAVAGELTRESGSEQASAGIDRCTPAEFERFQASNAAYRDKFGFPFIMAVRGSNRQAILAAFDERLQNDYDSEFRRALNEVHKIARLRIEAQATEPHD